MLNLNLYRKISLVMVIVSFIIFPEVLFSYESLDYTHSAEEIKEGHPDNWVDESIGNKVVLFKKVRCPRCGMEFYYTPGKEGPHSCLVHYKVDETKKSSKKISELSGESLSTKSPSYEADVKNMRSSTRLPQDKDSMKRLSTLLGKKDQTNKKIDETSYMLSGKDQLAQLGALPIVQYELRQELICPYDGYVFFPEGDVIEERNLLKENLFEERPSLIEESFSKAIPFGATKNLKQFGYDLFLAQLTPTEDVEEKKADMLSRSGEALATLGMLKAMFMPQTGGAATGLSSQALKGTTAVIPISQNYIIGPGDTLVLNIWGSVQETFSLDVDREGKVILPKAGPLYVWGLKLKEAQEKIQNSLNQYYTNFKIDVSIGKLRDIQIYVMGEVQRPGSYTISGQSTVFQALYLAGGPTKIGSLRKIKILHPDRKEEVVDLYDFLLEGNVSDTLRLQSGDTIFVPPIGDVVAITGNVKRPAIYETKSDILLSDLLRFAGGITPTGDLQRLQVERIENNERRTMLDIELKRTDIGKFSLEDIKLQSGDLVIVSPIVRLKHNFVSIIGNVERPGDYSLTKNMKISDLIKRAKGFLPGTYLQRAEIARVTKNRTREIIPVNLEAMMLGEEKEDLYLEEWDIVLVYSQVEMSQPLYVEIDGAVPRPGRYELTPGMKVSDLIFRAGGLRPDEVIRGAELFHIIPGKEPVVRDIQLKQISDVNFSIDKDIILHAGDAVFVKSEPKLTKRRVVTLKGEVRFPGVYSIRKGETLSSLIERAGGFTDEAFLEGAIFTRKSIKEAQEKLREDYLERENRNILAEQQALLLRGGTGMDPARITESLKMRQDLLNYIASAKIEGRMVIKILPLSQLKGSKYDILLEDGDTLTIPQVPSSITVLGSVNNPTSIPYEPGKGVDYYIAKTGGLTKHADRSGIYVIKANGEAVSKFMMSKSVERGATIVVPQEFKYWTPPGQLLRDTVEILSRIAVGVGIIAALD